MFGSATPRALRDDFLRHVLVIEIHSQGILYRESSAYVQAVEFRAYHFQVTVHTDTLGQLVPVVCGVPYSGVYEEMQHLQMELAALADHVFIERKNVAVAYAETGRIELEIWLFLGRDTDSQICRHLYEGVQVLEFVHVVQHRYDIVPSGIGEIGNILDVRRLLEAVAYDVKILVDSTFSLKSLYQVQVEGRGCLDMDIILQCFPEHKFEM